MHIFWELFFAKQTFFWFSAFFVSPVFEKNLDGFCDRSIVPKVGQMNEHHGPSTVNCCTKQGVGRLFIFSCFTLLELN